MLKGQDFYLHRHDVKNHTSDYFLCFAASQGVFMGESGGMTVGNLATQSDGSADLSGFGSGLGDAVASK